MKILWGIIKAIQKFNKRQKDLVKKKQPFIWSNKILLLLASLKPQNELKYKKYISETKKIKLRKLWINFKKYSTTGQTH